MRTPLLAAICAGLLVPHLLPAQSLRGRLIGPDSAAAAGAIVYLVDSAGVAGPRMLTTAAGGFFLRAPRAGTYKLRVLRIGYPAFESPPQTLVAGVPGEYSATLQADPITLTDLEVTAGGDACRSDAATAGATATLLEEVRKAFGSLDLALRDRDLRFTVHRYVRRSDENLVLKSQDSVLSMMTTWPVRSLPAELLRDRGFVQRADSVDASFFPGETLEGRIWFGPDPLTLLAEPFLETHCYKVVRDRHDADRIGLAFSPGRGRRPSDISGTLWLRRGTLSLEKLEYIYVNIPSYLSNGRAGGPRGEMEFLRLPHGLWVVSRWDVRVPIEEYNGLRLVGVAGWFAQGGTIRKIRTVQGLEIY